MWSRTPVRDPDRLTRLTPLATLAWPLLVGLAVAMPSPAGVGLALLAVAAWFASGSPRGLAQRGIQVALVAGVLLSHLDSRVPMIALAAPLTVLLLVWRPGMLCPGSWRVGLLVTLALGAATAAGSQLWVHASAGMFVFPMLPGWLAGLGGPGMWVAVAALSVVNATAEEVVWRHCLPGSVRAGTGSTAAACLVSSASFAAMHWHAIPSGPSGVLLTFAFAVAAFVAVRLTGSLLPSITAHLVADLVLIHWLIG